jgi:hypothetical protein
MDPIRHERNDYNNNNNNCELFIEEFIVGHEVEISAEEEDESIVQCQVLGLGKT